VDIGTSKIAAIVAEMKRKAASGDWHGQFAFARLEEGRVVNIESTVNAIQRALEEAGADGRTAKFARSGPALPEPYQEFNSHGMVAIKDRGWRRRTWTAWSDRKAIPIPTDQQILHVLNQEFVIDGQEDVREPLGMSGVRLR